MTPRRSLCLLVFSLAACGGSESSIAPHATSGCDTSNPSTAPSFAGCDLRAGPNIGAQGPLVDTGIATDLGLLGAGFFVVQNGSTPLLTRAGRFVTDKDGNLVSPQGLPVLGWTVGADSVPGSTLGTLHVGSLDFAPIATTNCSFAGNLNADAIEPTSAFDPVDPTSYNMKADLTLYDTLGHSYDLEVFFVKTATGAWDFHGDTDGANVTGGTAGTSSDVADGNLTFDARGSLTTLSQTSNFTPAGSVNPQALNFIMNLTQFAGTSEMSFTYQDGEPGGSLRSIAVTVDGEVIATASNGDSKMIAQVAIANVPAPSQLELVGDHLYRETADSGPATLGPACQGPRACVEGGSYETLPPDPSDCTATH